MSRSAVGLRCLSPVAQPVYRVPPRGRLDLQPHHDGARLSREGSARSPLAFRHGDKGAVAPQGDTCPVS